MSIWGRSPPSCVDDEAVRMETGHRAATGASPRLRRWRPIGDKVAAGEGEARESLRPPHMQRGWLPKVSKEPMPEGRAVLGEGVGGRPRCLTTTPPWRRTRTACERECSVGARLTRRVRRRGTAVRRGGGVCVWTVQ
jgi:hypothetical protein